MGWDRPLFVLVMMGKNRWERLRFRLKFPETNTVHSFRPSHKFMFFTANCPGFFGDMYVLRVPR